MNNKALTMTFLMAIYDSPITWCRELWVDGRLDCFLTAELLLQRGVRWPWRSDPPPEWLKPWRPGMIQGDLEAVPEARR